MVARTDFQRVLRPGSGRRPADHPFSGPRGRRVVRTVRILRFPEDFAFKLSPEEWAALKSQFVTSKTGHGGRRKPPRVFTEQGVATKDGWYGQ